MPFQRRTSRNTLTNPASYSNIGKLPPSYGGLQTGKLRHENNFDVPVFGDPGALALDTYFMVENARFIRTSTASPDEPITPSVSNNLGTSQVMNGSSISNFKNNIRLVNQDTNDTTTLDIYSIALSWYDALVWNDILPDSCPVSFDPAGVGAGQVTIKGTFVPDLSPQDWNNFKFIQHYMQHLGTVTIGNADNDNIVEFTQTRIPPKVRRSQTGMYWATLFTYSSLKNTAAVANLDFSQEIKYDEHPSEQRLPFIT